MPFVFPAHQIRRNGKLFAVCILALPGEIEILAEELHRVHVELSCKVIQSAHGEDGSLRVVRSAPRPRGTDVVADCSVFLALVRNAEDIWNGGHTATAGTAGAPGVGLPRDKCAVLFRGYFHASVSGR